jgi:alkylhydroperoxidase family enzyme
VGAVPGFLPRLASAPWVARAFAIIIDGPYAYVSPALLMRVAVVVTQDNSCRYCFGTQRAVLRIHGYSDADIAGIVRDSNVDLSAADRAAVDFARRVSRANPRPGRAEFDAAVAAGNDPRVVLEVATVTAFGNFMNRVATLLALPPEPLEAVVDQRLFRFVRPLLAWRMRAKRKPPVPPPAAVGPCARVIAALGDSPAAPALRTLVDGALASSPLPARTKLLLLAVIARALGCAWGEGEAREGLIQEGFAAADVDEVLRTLASARLDAREARLVPFARETTRYQPAAIQLRAAEVYRGLTPAETVDAVGFVALANALCRLSVVLGAC